MDDVPAGAIEDAGCDTGPVARRSTDGTEILAEAYVITEWLICRVA